MYGKPKELTIQEILKRVSEWDLWSYYVPGIVLKTPFLSPLMKDTTPSASLFQSRDGNLLLKDFRLGTYTIWSFLQTKYGLTFYEALLTVNNDFNLGLVKVKLNKPTTNAFFGLATKQKAVSTGDTTFKIKVRKWNKADEDYWKQFGLTTQFLEEHNVKPLENYWVNYKLVYCHTEYDPAYSYEFGRAKRKIYRPLTKQRNFRFLTNAKDHIWQGIKYLPTKGDSLIITKSYKDVLVLKSLGYNSVAPQSEAVNIEKDTIIDLKSRFSNIYLLYDNDEPGKKYSNKVCVEHNLIPIFVPEPSASHKDISDYRQVHGEKKTLEFLIKSL
jgi:hypothetical protein